MSEIILSNFALHIVLGPAEKEQILYTLQKRTVRKKEFLVQTGEIERQLYFVQSGCLRLFHTDKEGQEHNLCFYPENWWACDIVSFFKAKPAIYSIQALEDTELSCFSLPDLEHLFVQIPKLERFFRILTQNGSDLFHRRLSDAMSTTAEQRYLKFRKRYPGLEQRIAQKHIAGYLGITPAFLSMMRKARNL